MAIFLHELPYRKNAIHFLTMAIFPYGNFPRDLKFVAKFLAFETPIWGGHFRSKKFRSKKSQHFSQKRPGGGVKGRLELFQKFIDNGTPRLPLETCDL